MPDALHPFKVRAGVEARGIRAAGTGHARAAVKPGCPSGLELGKGKEPSDHSETPPNLRSAPIPLYVYTRL